MTTDPLRVLTVFGTRPEAVKLAPVIARLRAESSVQSITCVTAQHRQMLDQVLQLFEIDPDYDLNLMQPDQSLPTLSAAVLSELAPVIDEARPDWVMVQGDTTSVMAAALLSYFKKVRVAHVEAGLRTGDKWQPFPEEINRRVASVIADLHFAPTELAKENLLREGISDAIVHVTGNPVIDALHSIAARPFQFEASPIGPLPADRQLVLVTAHRRESFGAPLQAILDAIALLAQRFSQAEFIYPVHLNPNVHQPAHARLGPLDNVRLIEPLDYLPMVHLMKHSRLILTDSGGIQEEAPALGVPVLVLREKTERPEALTAGTAQLVGTDTDRIVQAASELLQDEAAHARMAQARNPFGDGHAAERIVDLLLRQPR